MTTNRCTYKLLPTQYEFIYGYEKYKKEFDNSRKNELDVYVDTSLYQGGVGSGKTFCGALRGLLYALQWAGCTGLVGAASQDLLDSTTKGKYLEHLDIIGLKEGVHWWYRDRKQCIEFCNGSRIRFKTLSDWSQFRSTEFTWIEIEEASLVDEKTFKELAARLREYHREEWGDGYFRSIFLHSNPQGCRGWMYKMFINPKTRKENFRYNITSSKENYHLGDYYVDYLSDMYSPEEAQEMLEGKDVDRDNTIAFPSYSELNVKEGLKYDRNYPLILTCDFNYNPMCWYLIQEIEGKYYILNEFIYNNITTKEMCKMITPTLEEYRARNLYIMGDAHGRDNKTNGSDYSVMLSYFSNLGYNCTLKVQKSNPRIKERISLLRGLVCNANMERRVFIDASCKRLRYNFEEAKVNLANGGLKEPTDQEIQNDMDKLYLIHPIDAVSYPMYFIQSYKDITEK